MGLEVLNDKYVNMVTLPTTPSQIIENQEFLTLIEMVATRVWLGQRRRGFGPVEFFLEVLANDELRDALVEMTGVNYEELVRRLIWLYPIIGYSTRVADAVAG